MVQIINHKTSEMDRAEIMKVFGYGFTNVEFWNNTAIVTTKANVDSEDFLAMANIGWAFDTLYPEANKLVKISFTKRGF